VIGPCAGADSGHPTPQWKWTPNEPSPAVVSPSDQSPHAAVTAARWASAHAMHANAPPRKLGHSVASASWQPKNLGVRSVASHGEQSPELSQVIR
jgi:hypothetical protein